MSKIKLTAAAVEKLKAPTAGRAEYFDTTFPGFGVRITDKGRKTFIVFYRFGGRQRRLTLGTYPALSLAEARKKASSALQSVEAGSDPADAKADAKARRPDTVENVVADFIERHAKRRNKGWKPVEQLFANHVTPRWKGRDIRTIERRDVIRLLDEMVDAGNTTQANRVLANVRKFFNWCVEREIVVTSPAAGVKPPTREKPRERALSEHEIRALWEAFDNLETPFGPLFKFMLMTAQRRGECAEIRWCDVDLDAALWTIPDTKNGKSHEVPLPHQAVTLLREMPRFAGGDYVFTTTFGARPVSGFGKPKDHAARLSGVGVPNGTDADTDAPPSDDWRLHDLRRSAATGMAHLGVPVDHISRVLNHAQSSVTAIYDKHSYLEAKRTALQTWNDALERVTGGGQLVAIRDNVVTLATGVA